MCDFANMAEPSNEYSKTKNPKCTVAVLKTMLDEHGLPVVGTKAELLNRLKEADPEGEWRQWWDESCEQQNKAKNVSRAGTSNGQQALSIQQREIEMYRKEKELMERELELARREIEWLRREQPTEINENRQRVNDTRIFGGRTRENVTAVADLLGFFYGKAENYDIWEKRIQLLKATYKLEDDSVKLVIGMRLKVKALEWLHSKPEYIEMPFDTFLAELRGMFQHRQSKLVSRKAFEERTWKESETFREYLHEKIIMGKPNSD